MALMALAAIYGSKCCPHHKAAMWRYQYHLYRCKMAFIRNENSGENLATSAKERRNMKIMAKMMA
jgi:hypothetical protein